MDIEMRPLVSIKPYDNNPRHNDAAVDAVAASIREFGFRQPLVVDEDNVIIVGHTRYKAAIKLGLETVPVHVARDLTAAQRPDGGWACSLLYPWDRADDKEQDLESSDGYGTGFAVFVLRKAGVPADGPAVARGVAWLKSHQRASGRWFTRSLNKDNEHFISHAGTAYAVMALFLAAFGLFAVLAHDVSQRTQEIGIRMALGAMPRAVLSLVLREGLQLTLAGLCLGMVAALLITKMMQALLFGVSPAEPGVFLAVAVLLLVVALLAGWIPARRAMLLDPLEALRQE